MTARTLPSPWDAPAVRRAVHREPELGFCEIVTADLVWRVLDGLGWRLSEPSPTVGRTARRLVAQDELDAAARRAREGGVPQESVSRFANGMTGFTAELRGTLPGPRIGIRVDLDALPVQESTAPTHAPVGAGFASRAAGRMHACGHDGHIAIALRLAAALAAQPDFAGSVRLILQPAEEGVRGAAPMVEAGACDDLDTLLGMHLGFGVPSGSVAVAHGLLATTKYRVDFHGRAAHAARSPEQGRHALLAAADAVLRIHALADIEDDRVRVNVGSLRADGATNIVPPTATLAAEVRAIDEAGHRRLQQGVRDAVAEAGRRYDVRAAISDIGRSETAVNDPALVQAVEAAAGEEGLAFVGSRAFGASDDASIMMNRVGAAGGRAAYVLFGSDERGPHHSPDFDVDESVLVTAARILEHMVRAGT